MRTVLINPPMNFDVALGRARSIKDYTVMIPHGLASIASFLRSHHIDVMIIDAYSHNLSIDQIVESALKYNPAVVGISSVTTVMPIANEIARRIKARNRSITTVAGGPHPTILPDETLSNIDIDFVVRGEGEITMLELLNKIEERDFSSVKGISYRDNGKVAHNPDREYIRNLDDLPMPAYDLLPMQLYGAPPQWSLAAPSYQLVASRGCPYSCGFCFVGMGKQIRYKSASNACDEIDHLIKKYNCKQIVFVDSTFPFNRKHAEQICGEIINRGLNKKIVWFTSTRVDIVDQDMLNLMHEAGCRLITYGVESGSQQILDFMNKGITPKQIAMAVKMAHKAKIDITASYILGLPGETRKTITDTIKFAKRLNTLYAQFNIIVPYPGTKVFDYAVENNMLRNRDWNNYVSLASMTDLEPPFIAAGLTKDELLSFQRKAYRDYYFRPLIMLKHMKKIFINLEFKKYYLLAKVLLDTLR